MIARIVNIVLGAVLILSGFLWFHEPTQRWNALIVGAAIMVVGIVALRYQAARYCNAVLGAWLVLSWLALPDHSMGTFYVSFLVGATVMVLAIFGKKLDGFSPTPGTFGRV